MKIIKNLADLHLKNSIVALGTFDGLHLGHRAIIDQALSLAKLQAEPCQVVVFSFSTHPLELLAPTKTPSLLLTYEDKADLLSELGVDILVSITFDKYVSELAAHDFLDILCSRTCPRAIVIGDNFTYGKHGKGNADSLYIYCVESDIKLYKLTLLHVDDLQVSSTNIRKLILHGDITLANKLLGRIYAINGEVIHGSQVGRTIGFPTANIDIKNTRLTIPAIGGYIVQVEYDGNTYQGIANIGFNPTVGGISDKRLEVHILNFHENIYGKQLKIYFHKYLCAEKKFHNLDELKAHINLQKQQAINYFIKTKNC